jgi:putative membrane protein
MVSKSDLPHIMAVINSATIVVLLTGYFFIRRGDRAVHRFCMIIALILGAAFLAIYLTYHFSAGLAKFGGYGVVRPIYFTLLAIHILMALVITPLVPITAYRALSGQIESHRRLAKWAWSSWLFVAVSGVVVYVMAVHIYPYGGA